MAQRLKTILFIGSAREGRMADRVVALVRSCLEADSHDVKSILSFFLIAFQIDKNKHRCT